MAITLDEWNALADEAMTRERYEALCARHDLPAASDRECWRYADYEYRYDDGQQPPLLHRLRQLRAWQYKREAATTERDREALAAHQRRNIAAYTAAVIEREALDRGN